MKRVALAIAMAALVMFAGCKKDKETTGTTLKASIEQQQGNGSKTSLDPSNGAIKWTAGDKIVVNNGTTSGTFTLTNGAGTTTGTFTYNGEYTFDDNNNIAVYPETAEISGTTVTVTMPAEQTYAAARNGSTPMLGNFTDPDNLTFTSLCGVLGISLKAASGTVDITAVEVVSKKDEKLNGTFTADANAVSDSLMLVKSGSDGTNRVRLNCTATLTTTEAQNFFFALPVGTLANGFTLNVYGDGADPIFSTDTNKDITIVLNQVNQMPAVSVTVTPAFNPLTTPLTFEARAAGITVSIEVDGLEYSTDGENWSTYTSEAEITLPEVGDKVSFKAASIISTTDEEEFEVSGSCWVYGNVMSFLYNDFTSATSVGEEAFSYLFYDTPIDIPADKELLLPATTLAKECYYKMFYYCEDLTKAPALPATTMAESCYSGMFEGCESLTTAPALPATALAENCYENMFNDCESLTTAPALPATTLEEDCYEKMFSGCTSLTAAPTLPATTMAQDCYYEMFKECTSLTTAPALPATTLAYGCYSGMFEKCTSLTTAPALPATTLAESCYYEMFKECTSLTAAPALPATTLAKECYCRMFHSCTNLTTPPVNLSATTLAESCYDAMFYQCYSLTSAPALPATALTKSCYDSMFFRCTSLTTAPDLPATSLEESCYAYMFQGCTSLTTAPVLPAATLVTSCYSAMFSGCSNLNNVTCLATNISATNSHWSWLYNVASTGTLQVALGMTSVWPTGSSGVPSGWTIMEQAPTGAINGKFTVNSTGKQVYFSQGNLQYIGSASTPYWKFADHQWDRIGTGQNVSNANINRDYFGWGTSGYNHGATCYQPWATSTTHSDYYAYGNANYDLNSQTPMTADWGYNAISNGGNQVNIGWRALTQSEWNYVINSRNASTVNGTANARFAKASLDGINGVILFPDVYTHPGGVAQPTNINATGSGFNNSYTIAEFELMQAQGAVFLPAGSARTDAGSFNQYGIYWTASHQVFSDNSRAYSVGFWNNSFPTANSTFRSSGLSVRLVIDKE